jgi:hypothetical protein
MQNFKTTTDVFDVVKPTTEGKYRCPVKGCQDKEKLFVDSKDFGRHLAIKHKIPSPKHTTKAPNNKKRQSDDLPTLTIKFCPHCGGRIEELEQAAELLRRTGK